MSRAYSVYLGLPCLMSHDDLRVELLLTADCLRNFVPQVHLLELNG